MVENLVILRFDYLIDYSWKRGHFKRVDSVCVPFIQRKNKGQSLTTHLKPARLQIVVVFMNIGGISLHCKTLSFLHERI